MATLTTPIASAAPKAAQPGPRRRHRYADNVYLQDGYVVIGILTALLFLLVAVSMNAAGHVDDMTVLLPVTLGAFVLGLLLSFSRFDGFFALSLSLFSGLAWILYQMTPLVAQSELEGVVDRGISPLQAKSYIVLVRWMQWIADAIANKANEDNFVFIFEMSFLVWWLTFLGVWSIFRYGYTWRAVIPAGIVLVISTCYAPKSTIGFLVLFVLVAMVLLVRTNLAEQQLRWRERRTYFNSDISLDFMRNALIYSVIVLAVAWIVPGLGQSPQLRTLTGPVNTAVGDILLRIQETHRGLTPSQYATGAAFDDSLTLGGPRNPGVEPVFEVDSLDGRYWRAIAFDTFTGAAWENTITEQARYEGGEPLPVMAWEMRQPVTHTIDLMADTGGILFGPADIRQVDVDITSGVVHSLGPTPDAEGDTPPGPIELIYARSSGARTSGDSYTVVSNHATVTELALNEAGTDYPAWITDRYLQLPDNLSQSVRDLAGQLTVEEETVYGKAKAVEAYLREIEYDDQIEAPPEGVDPVAYFLFDIQRGYCDYYATSMVTMLRSVGIPSRAVSGYAGGTKDPETGVTLVTEQQAHTWVEVYFPEYGWIEFEPTAKEPTLDRASGEEVSESGAIPGRPENLSGGGDPGSSENPLDPYQDMLNENIAFPEMGASDGFAPWWLWATVLPMALLLAVLVIRRAWFLGPIAFSPDLPPMLYERMQRWGTRLGVNLGDAQTPYEQANRMKRAIPDGQTYIDDITTSYVHYSFGDSSVSDQEEALPTTGGPAASWLHLRRLFWKEWIRKTLHLSRRKQNPYHLTNR